MQNICHCEKCKPIHEWVGQEVPSGICKVCDESHGVDMVINYCSQCLDVILKERQENDSIFNKQIDWQ